MSGASGTIGSQFQPALAILEIARRLNTIRVSAESQPDIPVRERLRSLDMIITELADATSAVGAIPGSAGVISELVEITSSVASARTMIELGQNGEFPDALRRITGRLVDIADRLAREGQRSSEAITNAIRRRW